MRRVCPNFFRCKNGFALIKAKPAAPSVSAPHVCAPLNAHEQRSAGIERLMPLVCLLIDISHYTLTYGLTYFISSWEMKGIVSTTYCTLNIWAIFISIKYGFRSEAYSVKKQMVILPLFSFEYIPFSKCRVSLHPLHFPPVCSITQRTLDAQPAQNVTRPPDPETPWRRGPCLGERDWVCAGWRARFETWGSRGGRGPLESATSGSC